MITPVSELQEGAILNWAVAHCLGIPVSESDKWVVDPEMDEILVVWKPDGNLTYFSPSTKKYHGDAILSRATVKQIGKGTWEASYMGRHPHTGSTELVATMRSFVAYKCGQQIDIPEQIPAALNQWSESLQSPSPQYQAA